MRKHCSKSDMKMLVDVYHGYAPGCPIYVTAKDKVLMVKYELRQFNGKAYTININDEILDDLKSVYVENLGIYLSIHGC